jgi:hypothetical protein
LLSGPAFGCFWGLACSELFSLSIYFSFSFHFLLKIRALIHTLVSFLYRLLLVFYLPTPSPFSSRRRPTSPPNPTSADDHLLFKFSRTNKGRLLVYRAIATLPPYEALAPIANLFGKALSLAYPESVRAGCARGGRVKLLGRVVESLSRGGLGECLGRNEGEGWSHPCVL